MRRFELGLRGTQCRIHVRVKVLCLLIVLQRIGERGKGEVGEWTMEVFDEIFEGEDERV
jgi:hypothetical protein